MDKLIIRKKHIYLRNQLSIKTVSILSNKIMTQLIESDLYKQCDEIFIYVGVKNEVDTCGIITKAFEDGKKIAVPKTIQKGIMKFYYIYSLAELVLGNFGLLEPKNITEEAKSNDKTIFLVPGVVFDQSKNRIGYGAGFYDNYLNNNPYYKVIALAYESQIIEEVPVCSYDVKMDFIISENRIYH